MRERLHAARRALRTAYEQRDALAEDIAAAEAEAGAAVRPDLLDAFSAAERAVLAAEAEIRTPNTPSPSRASRHHADRDHPRRNQPVREDQTAMRKPRDIDAELKALQDKQKQLRARRVVQFGELVTATGADALDRRNPRRRAPRRGRAHQGRSGRKGGVAAERRRLLSPRTPGKAERRGPRCCGAASDRGGAPAHDSGAPPG